MAWPSWHVSTRLVAIAEYPFRAAMLAMVKSPDQAIEVHRMAGLAGQLNIRTKVMGG
jgi:hypothetical protein